MREEWRPVVGWESKYEISSLGRLRRTETGRVLKPNKTRNGYIQYALGIKNTRFMRYAHTLVMEAFCGPYAGEVDHLDNDPGNNSITNLRVTNRKDNVRRTQSKPIVCMSEKGFVAWFPSTQCLPTYGFSQGHAASCARGERKTHKGFKWEYVNAG